jgi:hypothetical protein
VYFRYSKRNTALTVVATLEAKPASVDSATTLLAANIPRTGDDSAVLSLSEGRTPTARLKLDRSVDAFKVSGGEPGDGACIEAGGAEGDRASFVGVTLPSIPARRVGRRGSRWGGGVGQAHVKTSVPTPTFTALRGRVVRRRGVRGGAATLRRVPVVGGGGAIVTFGRSRRGRRAAVGKTAALGFIPELVALAALACDSSRGNKRQSRSEHNKGGSETGD